MLSANTLSNTTPQWPALVRAEQIFSTEQVFSGASKKKNATSCSAINVANVRTL